MLASSPEEPLYIHILKLNVSFSERVLEGTKIIVKIKHALLVAQSVVASTNVIDWFKI